MSGADERYAQEDPAATDALEATIEDLRRKCERYEALKSLLRDIDAP